MGLLIISENKLFFKSINSDFTKGIPKNSQDIDLQGFARISKASPDVIITFLFSPLRQDF